MAWCPNCKLEYVEGVTVCPDCKAALVDSLDEQIEEFDFASEEEDKDMMASIIRPYIDELPDEEAQKEIVERAMRMASIPQYKSKEDAYSENKSGAVVLIACGILGLAFIVLLALGIISLPIAGFSNTIMYTVMGCLFLIFLATGIRSAFKAKSLKDKVVVEKQTIDDIVSFIKENKEAGKYNLSKESEDYEEKYLLLNEIVVADVNEKFPELEPGFAFYVVDRFAGEILDED